MNKRIVNILILACFIIVLILTIGFTQNNTKKTSKNTVIIEGKICSNIADNLINNVVEILKNEVPVVTSKEPFEEYYMYTSCNVNMRSGPSTDFEVLDTLMPNVYVKVCGIENDWSHISVDDSCFGYIKSEYLSPNEIPISSLNRWGIDLTKDEIDLLARIVYLEAGIDSLIGKEAVVEVVFNRLVFSDSFDNRSLHSILSEQGQFHTWKDRNSSRCNPGSEEYEAIYKVLYGRTNILSSKYVYFSTRGTNGKNLKKVGKHWFGTE